MNGIEKANLPYNPRLDYRFGRRTIKIPLSSDMLNEVNIHKYLPHIMRLFRRNVDDCRHFDKVYRGQSHIFDKKRLVEGKKNTIINENHAFYMIEFKKGQMYGEPLQLSVMNDSDSTSMDEIKYLNKYNKDQYKGSKDIELGENVYKYGNAYRIILPKIYDPQRNLDKESPYTITNLNNKATFVVYSSNFLEEKLMGGVVTTVSSADPNSISYELLIYTKDFNYRFKCGENQINWYDFDFVEKVPNPLKRIPIVEFYTNTARLGIIDILETIFDGVNSISSDSVDNVNDYVNSILAIYNMTINKEAKENIEENKAIELLTNDPTRPADAKYLTNALNQGDVLAKYESLLKVAYGIVGVPMPTTKSTSGGDTGEARNLGGGWQASEYIAKQNEEPLKQGEILCTELALQICKIIPKCPIRTIYTSDIEFNFNRTNRENILTKFQAMKYGTEMDMPLEVMLNLIGVTSAPHEVAMAWEEYRNKKKEANLLELQKQQNKADTDVLDDKGIKDIKDTKDTQKHLENEI